MKKYPPITSSLRHVVLVNHSSMHAVRSLKRLTVFYHQYAGRGARGRCCFFSRGGGVKSLYRVVDFRRQFFGIPAVVQYLEYDPRRSAFVALVLYSNGVYSYLLAPFQLSSGMLIRSSTDTILSSVHIGYSGKLRHIPVGTIIHSMGILPYSGGQLMRCAGSFGTLLRKENDIFVVVRLRSGERRYISADAYATIGSVSNFEYRYICLGKAGRSRWLNYRPNVRGVAMNPIDHPHGGDTSSGKVHSTPWGVPTKGKPTRVRARNFIALF